MAVGRNDFLWCSLRQRGWICLFLKVLFRLSSVLWRGYQALSITDSSFVKILSSATASSGATLTPAPYFLISLFTLLASAKCLFYPITVLLLLLTSSLRGALLFVWPKASFETIDRIPEHEETLEVENMLHRFKIQQNPHELLSQLNLSCKKWFDG